LEFMTRLAAAASFFFFCMTLASAQTLDELKNDGQNADNVLTDGMGYLDAFVVALNRKTGGASGPT
jgi:hypothetical protein